MLGFGGFLFLLNLVTIAVLAADKNCEIWSCSNPSEHVYCKHNKDELSGMCGKPDGENDVVTGLSSFETQTHGLKEAILRAHSKFRTQARCEQARQIQELEWDEDLAKMAERWSKQCVDDNDKCRNHDKFASTVYQNVNMFEKRVDVDTRTPGTLVHVDQWIEEWSKKPYNPVWPNVSYHYNLNRVGCGMTKSGKLETHWFSSNQHDYKYFFVCNYAELKK